jgi:hypothetical protein
VSVYGKTDFDTTIPENPTGLAASAASLLAAEAASPVIPGDFIPVASLASE